MSGLGESIFRSPEEMAQIAAQLELALLKESPRLVSAAELAGTYPTKSMLLGYTMDELIRIVHIWLEMGGEQHREWRIYKTQKAIREAAGVSE